MRKAAAAVAVTAEDSVWIKMVAWHLLRLGLLIVLASALGKARRGSYPSPHESRRQEWDGEEQSSCICSVLDSSVRLLCPVKLSQSTFVGQHWKG